MKETANYKLRKNEPTDNDQTALVTNQGYNLDTIDSKLKSIETNIGLFQAGLSQIVLTEANVWKTVHVDFSKPFDSVPSISLTHSGQQLYNLELSLTNISATGFDIQAKLQSSTGTVFPHWIAVRRTQ